MVLRDSDSVLSAGGTTVRVLEIVTRPKVAEIVTAVGCETTRGTILKVRVSSGSSTTRVDGTGATPGLLLTTLTTEPPEYGRSVSVAFAETALPPATVACDSVKSASARPRFS